MSKTLLERVSPRSALASEVFLRTAVNHAIKKGIIGINPFDKLDRIKVTDSKKEYLTLEEIQKLANTPCRNDELKLGFLFSCFTGLRWSDLQQLTWNSFKNGEIHFTQKKTGDVEVLPLANATKQILFQKGNHSEQSSDCPQKPVPQHKSEIG